MNKQEILDAIEALEMQSHNLEDCEISKYVCYLAISALKQQLNHEWIPVINDDEHYPEAFKNVRFTDGYDIYIGFCDPNYTWFATDGEHTNEIELVTAWKPLDEPYTE